MESEKPLEVTIKTKDQEVKFIGNVEEVTREVLTFLSQIYPQLTLISNLTLTIDNTELLEECKGVFAITNEGVVVIPSIDSLSDREQILLYLARAYFSYITKKSSSASITISELMDLVRKPAGTVAARLSEMVVEGMVIRVGKGEYRVTTLGLDRFRKNFLPKVKGINA